VLKLYSNILGVCYNEDCNDEFLKVPYGTNMPGQTVCYKTQHNNLIDEQETKYDSCAPQLTQVKPDAAEIPQGLISAFLVFG
jgi:hypothetical protein